MKSMCVADGLRLRFVFAQYVKLLGFGKTYIIICMVINQSFRFNEHTLYIIWAQRT